MLRNVFEIAIAAQQSQVVSNTKVRHESLDSSGVHSRSMATIAQLRGFNVIGALGCKKWDGSKVLANEGARFGSREPLQKLLQHEPGRENCLALLQGALESRNRCTGLGSIAAQGQGPDTCVNE